VGTVRQPWLAGTAVTARGRAIMPRWLMPLRALRLRRSIAANLLKPFVRDKRAGGSASPLAITAHRRIARQWAAMLFRDQVA
jgi:hypothetical protein